MAGKKRRGGRVTPSKREQHAAPDTAPTRAPSDSHSRETPQPAASGRYTPKTPAFRLRPRWHRVAGWLGILLGVLIIVANDAMFFVNTNLLPFGHSELYLMLGLAVAAGASWFLGLFDRGDTIYG